MTTGNNGGPSSNFAIDPDLLGLVDNVALVTGGGGGGSGGGLGRAHCVQLARAGCNIVIAEINAEAGKQVAAEVEKLGRKALMIHADVSKSEDVDRVIDETFKTFGRLDVAVNHVGNHVKPDGTVSIGSFIDHTWESWNFEVQYSLKPTFLCLRAEALAMIKHGIPGRIINISTTDSVEGAARLAPYGTAKAGINHLTKIVGRELAPYGIRVNCLTPGGPWASAMQRNVERPPALQAFIEGCIAAPPAGLGEPMDIAGATVFLASKLSAYVVGHNVIADGGLTLTTARPDIGMGAKPRVLEEMEQAKA